MRIEKILEFFLETIFPSSLIEKKVRRMNFGNFNQLKLVKFDNRNKTLSFFKYKNPFIREAIKQIKYKRNQRLAKIFAEIIYEELLEELSELELFENFSNPVLVPVPMSKREQEERGYNQVELLIDEIAEISGGNLEVDSKILRKIKNTPRQTKLKRSERLENIKDVFEASEKTHGRNIILVDDVMTTGTTIGEARKVLEHARARSVFVIVIAK